MLELDFFLIFVFAHLVGDFVLQTDKIAKLKAMSKKGLIIHISVVTAVQILVLSVFSVSGVLAGFICGIIHFFIDYLKKALNKYLSRFQFLYFLFDQFLHMTSIYVLSLIFASSSNWTHDYIIFVRLLIAFIVLTYSSTVGAKILMRDLNPELLKGEFFQKNERIIDGVVASVVWAIAATPLFFDVILIPVVFLVFQKIQRTIFKYDFKICLVKFVSYTLIGFGMAFFAFR